MQQPDTPLPSHHWVLILRHPKEPSQALGSAPLIAASLERCVLKTGLSWPNLKKALSGPGGEPPVGAPQDPREWIALFLGARAATRPDARAGEQTAPTPATPTLAFFDRRNKPLSLTAEDLRKYRGILVLDGTWKQAKTLWWRNPWLLKMQRAVVAANHVPMYGQLRRAARAEGFSTLESTAFALSALGAATGATDNEAAAQALLDRFARFLHTFRDTFRQDFKKPRETESR